MYSYSDTGNERLLKEKVESREDRAENETDTEEMHQAKHRVCARMHVLQYLLLRVSGSRAKSINFNIKSLCTLKFETE